MRKSWAPLGGTALALTLAVIHPTHAQDEAAAIAITPMEAAEPAVAEPVAEGTAPAEAPAAETVARRPGPAAGIDPATIPLPDLAFEPTEEDIRNYRKYFYFHRTDTDFASAYADILECDAYARGFARLPSTAVPYPYAGTVGGVVGGVIGNAMADAIWGSAQRRELRRINMRACMGFKGYRTYGLSKRLWETFNFEEGINAVAEDRRARLLQVQARVASGPTPQVGEIRE